MLAYPARGPKSNPGTTSGAALPEPTNCPALGRHQQRRLLRAGLVTLVAHVPLHTHHDGHPETRDAARNHPSRQNLEPSPLLGPSSLNTVMVYTEPRLEDLAERMESIG